MMLSKSCDYGLRAILVIASQSQRQFIPIRELSDKLGISFHFLTKILQILTLKGFLVSFKGPRGGVRLATEAKNISLRDIVVAIDGQDLFQSCILGLNACGDEHPCPLHQQWAPIRDQLETMFNTMTLADLADKIHQQGFRLTDLLQSEINPGQISKVKS
jgi:Rrf2 family iron-sulfur cluster assembly transcriptional regulator